MSVKHPIVAIPGSSGAGTTSVMKSFQHIFRREGIRAQILEGDSMHRYNRMEMREEMPIDDSSEAVAPISMDEAAAKVLASIVRC